MKNVFETLTHYATPWAIKNSRKFTQEEKNAVDAAVVTNSNYGLSVCFTMVGGGKTFIPLSRDSELTAGDNFPMENASLITLEKEGEDDILRVEE